MYKKKECIAMLLAGGQGSRLYTLTEKTAKPAVPFGAKYRIIDFTLSNCVNSGIDTVGVLTQYQPLVLNEYIGNGQPWDLDRSFGGVMVLPPYQGKKSADWYKGTANAIYQNLDFINRYDPEYVLVLSGDHIYKMDYSLMLDYHKKTGADCTIAVIKVSIEEASRFGIMSVDDKGQIAEFEEKPAEPKSDLASMGIYIFNRDALSSYLVADNADPESQKDFGKNIIPKMLKDGKRMFAYNFSGYWKDVGTVDSLWEANMDLLGKSPAFDLYDREWRIFSRTNALPPQYIGPTSNIDNSIVTEGCRIFGRIKDSLVSEGVIVEEGCEVVSSVIMSGCVLKRGCVVKHSIIDSNTVIGEGSLIGDGKKQGKNKITVVGSNIRLRAGTVVPLGKMISSADIAGN